MTRIRIEGLLAAFPKLMGTGNQQHTFIETDSVRYVYQPIESLFLLLITNKASNIVEDLETLRLLSKVVPEIAGGISEEKVAGKMFELVFAFDEVLTTGGYRESITLQQIQTNLSMESHEEKLHKMIEQSKVSSAKEEADRKAKSIRDQNRERAKMAGIGGGGGMEGIGSGPVSGSETFGSSGYVGDGSRSFIEPNPGFGEPYTPTPEPEAPKVTKGMKLGGGSKKQQMMDKLVSEDNLTPLPSSGASTASATEVAPVPTQTFPITVVMEEKVNASLTREGAVETLEIKGTMSLTATDDAACRCRVILVGQKSPAFNFSVHPKVDKKGFESNGQLTLKDASKGFPKSKPVGILRWSMASTDDDQVPISINCWPEEDGTDMNVNVEYTVQDKLELHNVAIHIPLGTTAQPTIVSMETGSHRHNRSGEELVWEIPLIDAQNQSASLEFNVAQRDAEAFFPINISFSSKQMYGGIDLGNVISTETNEPIQFGLTKMLLAENYSVA